MFKGPKVFLTSELPVSGQALLWWSMAASGCTESLSCHGKLSAECPGAWRLAAAVLCVHQERKANCDSADGTL